MRAEGKGRGAHCRLGEFRAGFEGGTVASGQGVTHWLRDPATEDGRGLLMQAWMRLSALPFGQTSGRTPSGVRVAWPPASAPGSDRLAPLQRVVKPFPAVSSRDLGQHPN